MQTLITNDAIVFGLLIGIIAFTFYTSSIQSSFWQKFYQIIPSILVCYFVPGYSIRFILFLEKNLNYMLLLLNFYYLLV
jgi:hypothetical protein